MKELKTTIRIIAAGLAASLVLVSCAKQEAMDNGSTSPAGGARTIAVSFANASVKSELNGLQPKFVAGDEIMVSNGSKAETCTVEIEGDVASITTKLTGPLTMVYPAAAWSDTEPYFKVSTEQDGSFASANICKAEIAAGATSASFENQTAIFKLSVPEKQDAKGVDYVVKSLKVISKNGNIAEGSKEIKVGDGTSTIAAENGFYYVSVLPGETSSNLYVCAGAGARKLTGADAIAENKIYSVALPVLNGHEYVEINGLKWATMNIGATEVTGENSYGDYFMWGAVEKAYSSVDVAKTSGAFTFGTKPASYKGKNTTWDKTKGFMWPNALYTDGGFFPGSSDNVFTKYTGSKNEYAKSGEADGKTTLELIDDAANVNWGRSWRMPTMAEFAALNAITDKGGSTVNKGYTYGTLPAQIFLPFAGIGQYLDLFNDFSGYWSFSLFADHPDCACALYIDLSHDMVDRGSRIGGYPVRPVSD